MPPNTNAQHGKEWNLEDYLDLVLRRKVIILVVFIVVFVIVLAYALTRPDIYSSRVTFSTEQTQDGGLGSGMPYYYYYQMQKPIEYYQAVMNSGLFRDKVTKAALHDSILLANGGLSTEEIYGLLGRIGLSKEEYSDLMYMSITAFDPIVAYRIVDIASIAYKDRSREIQEEQARATVEYVNRQVALAEENLENAERKLEEFKSKTKFTAVNVNDGIIQRLNEIENKITELSTQRELAQANLDVYNERLSQFKDQNAASLWDNESEEIVWMRQEIEQLQNQKNALEENNASSRQIQQLANEIDERKQQLRNAVLKRSAENPSAQGAIGDEQELAVYQERKIEEELNLFTLKNQERYYTSLRDTYRKQHPNMLEHSIELAKLQRAKTVNATLYNFLIQKGEEAKIKAATGTGGVKVISPPAIPERPIPKNTMRDIFVGVILGLGLGVGLAFGLDLMDQSIHTPEDVEKHLALSTIGTIPHIDYVTKKADRDKRIPVLQDRRNGKPAKDGVNERIFQLLPMLGSKNPLVESYRNLRTDLQFVNVDEPIKSIMFTSATPGEGKSLNTANLAISFAELGKKVLIVDCDMRKPVQSKIFQVEKSPGVSDYLARELTVDEIIQKTAITNLSLVTAGTSPPNPAEMLDSHKMTELISKLTDRFDLLIFDSPPLIAVSDPKILAPKVQNVLLVVRVGKVNYRLVKDAYSRLDKVDAKVIGAVLNGVGTKRGYGYYSRYNYYHHAEYYTSIEKKSADKRRKKPYIKPQFFKSS
ncbi:polysaccharide biosynthesis tyrosine autokinase [candidate division KSB1 bacterium]|nr:polysaccharide biosynthesis tyrosine autokinase [candidate division KSB1 bacterium]RQW04355.1 MAG: polysaccharide biosynthesis tyrosine autokinase [candidate division KSB1 bacterium]